MAMNAETMAERLREWAELADTRKVEAWGVLAHDLRTAAAMLDDATPEASETGPGSPEDRSESHRYHGTHHGIEQYEVDEERDT